MISRAAVLVLLCTLVAGCESLFARGHGSSSDGFDDVEVGISF